MTIDQLQLAPNARKGAEWARATFPDLVFTSGRRDTYGQARAMAWNVVTRGQNWLMQTYKPSPLLTTLQTWLSQHPEADDRDTIADGFYQVFLAAHSNDVMRFSRHFTGDAWDAAWPLEPGRGEIIVAKIRREMPKEYGLDKVIDKEGDLRVIHVQFAPSVDI